MPIYDVSIDYFESAQSTRGRYTFNGRVAAPDPDRARNRLLGEFEALRTLSDGAWMAEVLDVTVERREPAEGESFEEAVRARRGQAADASGIKGLYGVGEHRAVAQPDLFD